MQSSFSVDSAILAEAMRLDQQNQTELAQVSGISQSTISRYLTGTVSPSREHTSRLVAALPSLKRLYECRSTEKKSQILANAEATAPYFFRPLLPEKFSAGPWEVSTSENGFPECYEMKISYSGPDETHFGKVRILYGSEPSLSRNSILEHAKKVVAQLRDAAGVIV
jgi:transcriptional regulator with XRE-family HTH domain